MTAISYRDYLSSREWASKRSLRLRAAEHKCEKCGACGFCEQRHEGLCLRCPDCGYRHSTSIDCVTLMSLLPVPFLDCHHVSYENFGNEDVARDLVILCEHCHHVVEKSKTRWSVLKEQCQAIAENDQAAWLAAISHQLANEKTVNADPTETLYESMKREEENLLSCLRGYWRGVAPFVHKYRDALEVAEARFAE